LDRRGNNPSIIIPTVWQKQHGNITGIENDGCQNYCNNGNGFYTGMVELSTKIWQIMRTAFEDYALSFYQLCAQFLVFRVAYFQYI